MKDPRLKGGTLIVRTGNSNRWQLGSKIGSIYKMCKTQSPFTSGDYTYASGWSIKKDECRKATKKEVAAYEQGIRHIDDIGKAKGGMYAIY